MLRTTRFTVLTTILMSLAACVSKPDGAGTPRLPNIPTPGTVVPTLPPPDMTAVSGKTICIDPGHGGSWTGAVAENGLQEADANLGVSLHLADLLTNAGARVILTRSNRQALVPDNMSADLAARAQIANDAEADVFLSVHHNADIVANSTKDDLEMYYAMHDDGASRDLAEALTVAMAQGFRNDAERRLLLPGNYKVLRLCTRPSVLLETGYLTHRPTAERLSTAEGQQAEAVSIAQGLAAYFALRPPSPKAVILQQTPAGKDTLAVSFHDPTEISIDTLRLTWNGEPVPFASAVQNTAELRIILSDPLRNGEGQLLVRGRNRSGAAFTARVSTTIDRPPYTIAVTQRPEDIDRESSAEIEFDVLVLDIHGLPVRDNTDVQCHVGSMMAKTRSGHAYFHIPANATPAQLPFAAGGTTRVFDSKHGKQTYTTYRVQHNHLPLAGAQIHRDESIIATTSPGGWAALPGPPAATRVAATGYHPASAPSLKSHTTVTLDPVAPALLDRRIVIDPIDGGRNAGVLGPDGVRASDRNLVTAQTLAAHLSQAGAHVLLLRNGDDETGELTRILAAEEHNPEIYISIAYGITETRARLMNTDGLRIEPPLSFLAHYPGSGNGSKLAHAIADALGVNQVVTTVYYPVQQVSCPAVLCQPRDIRLGDVTNIDAIAFGERIAAGVAAYFRALPK